MSIPSPRRYRRLLVELSTVLALVLAVQWWQARPLASGPAPGLAGQLVDGRPYALGQALSETGRQNGAEGRHHKGQTGPVLVHFWATWCPVCQLGQATIDAIARDSPVVTVAVQSGGAPELRAYLSAQGLAFPVLPDPDGALSARWGVPGVPASFVVDGTGRIRFATAGHTTQMGLRARLWLARLLE